MGQVHIQVNSQPVALQMQLGAAGEAYFLRGSRDQEGGAPQSAPAAGEGAGGEGGQGKPYIPPLPLASLSGGEPPGQAARTFSEEDYETFQEKARWSWGWGGLPKRRLADSLSNSLEELPQVAGPEPKSVSEPELSPDKGTLPLNDDTSPPSPRISPHLSQAELPGYSSDSDAGKGTGWQQRWGMGALFRMFKPETEPVYLIKPIDSDLVSAFCSDDEGEEEVEEADEYFYSAISPRETSSHFPRNISLDKLDIGSSAPYETTMDDATGTVEHGTNTKRKEPSLPNGDEGDEAKLNPQSEVHKISGDGLPSVIPARTGELEIQSPEQQATQASSSDDAQPIPVIEMSLCGALLRTAEGGPEITHNIFAKNLITWEEFQRKPEIIWDRNLVFKVNDRIYPRDIGLPLAISYALYRRPLPQANSFEASEISKAARKSWKWWWSSPAPAQDVQKSDDARTLRPTSSQLAMMNLRPGANKLTFTIHGQQGQQEVTAMLYRWTLDTKIVISDIDGTITKSDLFGHILPILGKDWSHSGVAQLYSNIQENGYKILYLSSRSIGQANYTRGYISTLRQDDVSLAEGPLFTAPNGLLRSVHREVQFMYVGETLTPGQVIVRRPEEFKIACLKDISELFPNRNPYYAGFGNRPSDVISYRAVGVPKGKIFTINQRGEITITNKTYKKSYVKLNDLVNEMFPPVNKPLVHEEFNAFQYWKLPAAQVLEDL